MGLGLIDGANVRAVQKYSQGLSQGDNLSRFGIGLYRMEITQAVK